MLFEVIECFTGLNAPGYVAASAEAHGYVHMSRLRRFDLPIFVPHQGERVGHGRIPGV